MSLLFPMPRCDGSPSSDQVDAAMPWLTIRGPRDVVWTRRVNSRPSPLRKLMPGDRARACLWTQDGSYRAPVKVHVGLSDGTMTEVQGDDVKEGMEVILAKRRQTAAARPARLRRRR